MFRKFFVKWAASTIHYGLLASSVGLMKIWLPYWYAVLAGPAIVVLAGILVDLLHRKIFNRKATA